MKELKEDRAKELETDRARELEDERMKELEERLGVPLWFTPCALVKTFLAGDLSDAEMRMRIFDILVEKWQNGEHYANIDWPEGRPA